MSSVVAWASKSRLIKISCYMVAAAIVLSLKPDFVGQYDAALGWLCLGTLSALLVLHMLFERSVNYFRIDILFLLGFVLVHFQWPLMLLISTLDIDQYEIMSRNEHHVNYGTWLSLLGLISWFIGYAFFRTPPFRAVRILRVRYRRLLYFSAFFFVAFLVFAGEGFLSGDIYRVGGTADAVSGVAGYIYTIFNVSIIVLTATVMYASLRMKEGGAVHWLANLDWRYLLLACSYVGIFLYVGDRGGPVQLLISFLLLYGALIKPVRGLTFALMITIGIMVMYVVGIIRAGQNEVFNSLAAQAPYDLTMGLGASSRTLYLALSHVPDQEGFFFGKLWLGNLLGVVPFSQSIYLLLSDDKSYLINSANYITYLRYGLNPPSGEGTSLVADIYLNFGSIGVVAFMALFGFFCKKMQASLERAEGFYAVLLPILFGGLALYVGRATLFTPLQIILWGYILAKFLVVKEVVREDNASYPHAGRWRC